MSTGSPRMQNDDSDDIQGMDDSNCPKDPVNISHYEFIQYPQLQNSGQW